MNPRAITSKPITMPLALTAETLYRPVLGADEPGRKQVQQALRHMRDTVEQVQVAQAAVSEIYTYTIWVASTSLAQVAQHQDALRAYIASPLFDEFERRQWMQLLTRLEQMADAATHSIVEAVSQD